ncbi:hypothetical protein ISCGN_020159 [Ixodes scapularis]
MMPRGRHRPAYLAFYIAFIHQKWFQSGNNDVTEAGVLCCWSQKCWREPRASVSVAVVAASQLPAVEASVDCHTGERRAADEASATSTTAAGTPPGSRPATA